MAELGNTELQPSQGKVPEKRFNQEDEQVIDFVRKTLKVTKERFFDTGQSPTFAVGNPEYTPGYFSMVAVTNPEQDMEVIVSYYNGLSAISGLVSEDINRQEIHIAYRHLTGSRAVPKPIRKKVSGYEFGIIVLPSGGREYHTQKPFSYKSTMRPSDIQQWDEGDTAPHIFIGNFQGQKSLQPTKADYEAILDTVTRGTKNEVLTRKSIENLFSPYSVIKWEEKKTADAQVTLERRNEEIMRGEVVAIESAEKARLLAEQTKLAELDHADDKSFTIGEQRLREAALQFSRHDAAIINDAADQLAAMGQSINMVRTLLESDDPKVKKVLKEVRIDHSEALLTPPELYDLAHFMATYPEFETIRENSGFTDGVIYGIFLDHLSKEGDEDKTETSNEAKIKILEALEFLHPGETITQRMSRIGGLPVYERTRSGEKTGIVHNFRHNPDTGESIIWNPYRIRAGQHSNIRITSPLFGPYFIAMVGSDLQISNNGKQGNLESVTGKINSITLRFEGGRSEREDIGDAMFRLSRKINGNSNFLKLVEG